MNIKITNTSNEYELNLIRSYQIRYNLLYGKRYSRKRLIYIGILLLFIGVFSIIYHYYILGSVIISLGLNLIYNKLIHNYKIRTLAADTIKSIKEFSPGQSENVITLITDDLFAFRTINAYFKFMWSKFSNYLICENFIFFITQNSLDSCFILNYEQLTEEEFNELRIFLASKLPEWKGK